MSDSQPTNQPSPLPFRPRKKKFREEEAGNRWSNYTRELVDSINESEKEGLEKGLSSYQIEKLWQEKTKARTSK